MKFREERPRKQRVDQEAPRSLCAGIAQGSKRVGNGLEVDSVFFLKRAVAKLVVLGVVLQAERDGVPIGWFYAGPGIGCGAHVVGLDRSGAPVSVTGAELRPNKCEVLNVSRIGFVYFRALLQRLGRLNRLARQAQSGPERWEANVR